MLVQEDKYVKFIPRINFQQVLAIHNTFHNKPKCSVIILVKLLGLNY